MRLLDLAPDYIVRLELTADEVVTLLREGGLRQNSVPVVGTSYLKTSVVISVTDDGRMTIPWPGTA